MRDVEKSLRIPEVANSLVAQGWDITASPPELFAAMLRAELDRWSKVVKSAGIEAN